MERKETNETRGITPDPSQSNNTKQEPKKGEQEGDFRNAEKSANKASDFGDEYEITKEDELTMEEPETEDNSRTGKS
jgi:hypothetical protein